MKGRDWIRRRKEEYAPMRKVDRNRVQKTEKLFRESLQLKITNAEHCHKFSQTSCIPISSPLIHTGGSPLASETLTPVRSIDVPASEELMIRPQSA